MHCLRFNVNSMLTYLPNPEHVSAPNCAAICVKSRTFLCWISPTLWGSGLPELWKYIILRVMSLHGYIIELYSKRSQAGMMCDRAVYICAVHVSSHEGDGKQVTEDHRTFWR